MRNFTTSERAVVKKLIEWCSDGQSIRLGEILLKLFPIQSIKPSAKKDEEFYKHTIDICYNQKKVSLSKILEAINLFDLLVQRNYIVIKKFFPTNIIGTEKKGMYILKKDEYFVEVPIMNYYNYDLWEFLCNHFYVTNGLIDFATDFKSIEQRRSDEQNCTAWMGIIAAIGIGIATPFITQCISEKDEQVKIEQIVNAIKEHNTMSIDSIKTLPADTFNVNIIQPKAKPTPKSQQTPSKQPIPKN